MILSPGWRKLTLTTHVACSVGFLGAVAAFVALALTGQTSDDAQTVLAAYIAMQVMTALIIVPLCFASLVTGVVASLGTTWGLFRHYWVLVKLLLTAGSTLALLVHLRPIELMAQAAAAGTASSPDLAEARLQLVFASGAALLVLLMTTALSIYKPRGLTRYGWRKQQEPRVAPHATA
jgi:hypothetical protein